MSHISRSLEDLLCLQHPKLPANNLQVKPTCLRRTISETATAVTRLAINTSTDRNANNTGVSVGEEEALDEAFIGIDHDTRVNHPTSLECDEGAEQPETELIAVTNGPPRPQTNAKESPRTNQKRPATWAPSLKKLKPPPPPQRTFTIMKDSGASGNFARNALLRRGWTEVPAPDTSLPPVRKKSSKKIAAKGANYKASTSHQIQQRRVVTFPTSMDLFWTVDLIKWDSLRSDDQIVNQIPTPIFSFASKVGILACAQRSHWFHQRGCALIRLPRSYRLFIDEEMAAFVGDFCLTACLSLIKFVLNTTEASGVKAIFDCDNGKVDASYFRYAIKQVQEYVRVREHDDIDEPAKNTSSDCELDTKWINFLKAYQKIAYGKEKFRKADAQESLKLCTEASASLNSVAPYWPQLNIDGVHNLWICKPGESSQGMGILVMNSLPQILKTFTKHKRNWDNSVVQKYIERPLLIYGTKFDIRQWFLVTSWYPLIVWFYKDCYLRFCSKPFDMLDFHERIHLCNYSVQSRYKIHEGRDSKLPKDNMWSSTAFREYLKYKNFTDLGKEDLWQCSIYRDMKKAILGILLPSQEYFSDRNTPNRRNCFQLYGADFMLSDDFKPWLIEINRFPLIANYPKLMKRMCERCIEDCMKVVVDRRDDPQADTGLYELIYCQRASSWSLPFSLRYDIALHGKPLTATSFKGLPAQSKQSLLSTTASLSRKSSRRLKPCASKCNNLRTKSSPKLTIAEPVVVAASSNGTHASVGPSRSEAPLLVTRQDQQEEDENGNATDTSAAICSMLLHELVGMVAVTMNEELNEQNVEVNDDGVMQMCSEILNELVAAAVKTTRVTISMEAGLSTGSEVKLERNGKRKMVRRRASSKSLLSVEASRRTIAPVLAKSQANMHGASNDYVKST